MDGERNRQMKGQTLEEMDRQTDWWRDKGQTDGKTHRWVGSKMD